MMKTICSVYRSPKKEGMYLYVAKTDDLRRVPEALMARFGQPQLAMTLVLTADKQLARVEAARVLESIEEKGFYLQMPPAPETHMQDIHSKNAKMPR